MKHTKEIVKDFAIIELKDTFELLKNCMVIKFEEGVGKGKGERKRKFSLIHSEQPLGSSLSQISLSLPLPCTKVDSMSYISTVSVGSAEEGSQKDVRLLL